MKFGCCSRAPGGSSIEFLYRAHRYDQAAAHRQGLAKKARVGCAFTAVYLCRQRQQAAHQPGLALHLELLRVEGRMFELARAAAKIPRYHREGQVCC